MEQYLINYLKNVTDDFLTKKYLDFFKVELDWFIYNFGDHITPRYKRKKKDSYKVKLYHQLQCFNAVYGVITQTKNRKNVLSSVSFTNKNILADLDINPISSIFQPVGRKQILGDKEALRLIRHKENIISNGCFFDLYNRDFYKDWEHYEERLISVYEKYDLHGLFLYTDQYFESKYLIDIFKHLNRPSFVFSHGLPGVYSLDVDNRSDYLMVWGERIKQNYIDAGFCSDKIVVVGNSKYLHVNKENNIRNSFDDILIIPCASLAWHQDKWGTPDLLDRSMVVLYLYQVQQVLLKIGVNHARFRPHPSIDKDWVYRFLDQHFYYKDNECIESSLRKSSLVIGSTSTVFLEALMCGVNYLIYEPNLDGKNILRLKLVPPFDYSEPNLEIASTEEELESLLRDKYLVDTRILDGYIQPLDLSLLKSLIR